MGKTKKQNEPIVLSGRVYLAGFLAQEVSGFDLPAALRVGDIKLHNVQKGGTRQRYGQPVVFSGFFAASVWNGKRFCRLLMRKKAAVDATYLGIVELRSKARSCAVDLRRLIALQADWVDADHGYEVTYTATSHPLAHKPAEKAADKPADKAAEKPAEKTTGQVEAPAAVAPVNSGAPVAAVAKTGEQLPLFPDMPVTTGKKRRRR